MGNKQKLKARPTARGFNSLEPASFDVEGFLGDFKPSIVTAKVYHRADLMPRLSVLKDEVKEMSELPAQETSYAEGDALSAKVIEFQNLQKEYLDGGYTEVSFIPRDKDAEIRARIKFQASKHSSGPKDQQDYWATLYLMAEMAVRPRNLSAEAIHKLSKTVGDAGMFDVTRSWLIAFGGGGQPDAPFSPMPLPTPGTAEQ